MNAATKIEAALRGRRTRRGDSWRVGVAGSRSVRTDRAGRCQMCGKFFDIGVLGAHARECFARNGYTYGEEQPWAVRTGRYDGS